MNTSPPKHRALRTKHPPPERRAAPSAHRQPRSRTAPTAHAPPKRLPKFRVHKASGQAYVELSGRRFYLGGHDRPVALQRYHSMVAEWLAGGRQLRVDPDEITVKEVVARYWVHAEQYYRNADDSLSTEVECIRLALVPVVELYAMSMAADFGPLALRAVRQKMIDRGLCRSSINKHVSRIKRVFKWAASEELRRYEDWPRAAG